MSKEHLHDFHYQLEDWEIKGMLKTEKKEWVKSYAGDKPNYTIPEKANWDERFLGMAHLVSTWSKDPSTKVGAVIVDKNKRIVSTGFNGFPKGIHDFSFRYDNKMLKYKMIVHAERNAILFAQRDLAGCTLYTWPVPCCAECAAMVIQAGIKKVVVPNIDIVVGPQWSESFRIADMMFREAGVEVVKHDRL